MAGLKINSSILQATLEILSQYQGKIINNEREEEPGKILHETDLKSKFHPQGYFPFPYYGSVDSTLLFLILFSFYYKKTKKEIFRFTLGKYFKGDKLDRGIRRQR